MDDSMKIIEEALDLAPEEFPAPIGKLLGLVLTEAEGGRATVEFEANGRHANPMGTLHGGVLCDIADAAMGIAYRTTLAEDESFTTLELNQFSAAGVASDAVRQSEGGPRRQVRRSGRVRRS